MITTSNAPETVRDAAPRVTFWGAAQVVTGSMHLVEVGPLKVLLDCGLNQGRRDEARQRNNHFPFHPQQIDAVLISHSHIDHCGNLPTLIHQGFQGPIFCTPATRDLLKVMLVDSAKIQEEDAAHLNILRNYAEPFVEPLYTRADVDQTLDQVIQVPFYQDRELNRAMKFQFIEAGHVLGSAMIHMTMRGEKGTHTLTFTGDLGRRHVPLLKPSAPVPPADLLVCESTYGNRLHQPIDGTIERLYETIRRTHGRGGKVLIPAFSLGRCQLIIHFLQRGIREGRIPEMPVYVDSPLAAEIANVYRKHPECLVQEIADEVRHRGGILGDEYVQYIRDFEESVRLSHSPKPHIVIAASGMCDAGRIVHHLKTHVDDPRCTVILVSFQAQGTTGRRLLESGPTVRFLGKDWNKWIDVVHLEGFSGHADRDDFMSYLTPLAGKVGKVRLIHGEREQAEALARTLRGIGFGDVAVPEPGDVVRFED